MGHQTGEAEEAKKRPEKKIETGFEPWKLWTEAVDATDIDPAELFDPDEFGYRRRGGRDAKRP